MRCPNCKKEFVWKNHLQEKRFCSTRCENDYKARFPNGDPSAPKSLDQWVKEADECGMDYGNYRALIGMGRTYEELKI